MADLDAAVGIYLATFVVAIVSGLFPLINSEAYLIGVVLAAHASWPQAILLGILVACGQMVANSILFEAARGASNLGGRRRKKLEEKLVRARAAVERWGNKRFALLCTSATIGLPPFLLTSLAAGAFGIPFRTFFVVGLAGRIVRFIAIAVGAALV
jgi:membrane protein YqaA with SNARE-associated domain